MIQTAFIVNFSAYNVLFVCCLFVFHMIFKPDFHLSASVKLHCQDLSIFIVPIKAHLISTSRSTPSLGSTVVAAVVQTINLSTICYLY